MSIVRWRGDPAPPLASIRHLVQAAREQASKVGSLHGLWDSIVDVEMWLESLDNPQRG